MMLPSLLGLMIRPKGVFWLDKIDPSSWIFSFGNINFALYATTHCDFAS
jgi:hypothetical protein